MIDELQTFVGNNKNQVWVWTVVNHWKPGILLWTVTVRTIVITLTGVLMAVAILSFCLLASQFAFISALVLPQLLPFIPHPKKVCRYTVNALFVEDN